jgi:hypothetical protein
MDRGLDLRAMALCLDMLDNQGRLDSAWEQKNLKA